MRKIITLIIFLLCTVYAYPQSIKLSDLNSKNIPKSIYKIPSDKTEDFELYKPIMLLWPLNPMIVVENSKVYFGLTKEVDIIMPHAKAKLGFEYSYIFRSERNNHFRVFADYIIPLQTGNFAAVLVNIGGGYFTDTKKSGLFPQASLSILVPFTDALGINIYTKVRETFMLKKEESNIFDFSVGIGATVFPF